MRLKDKHELYLLTFAQKEEEFQYKEELEKIFKEVHLIYLPKWRSALNCVAGLWSRKPLQVLYFQSRSLENKLTELLARHQFDAVHVQHLRMSPYLADEKNVPRILDLPDAFSLYWERRSMVPRGFARKIFETIEQGRVLKYESIIDSYDLSLVCSQEDLEYIVHTHATSNIKLLPNGVDMTTFYSQAHNYAQNNTILFTGNMDYSPNVDAVIYFTKEILPAIREQFPSLHFIIAGQRPVKAVTALAADPNITVTGFVKDLAAMYNSASVVVAPLRFGAGTQNKVLEAMAMGVPVVCSNIGFAGLGIASGEGAIMQTDPGKFANAVIELLNSEDLRKSVGTLGTDNARKRFDWDVISGMLDAYFKDIVSGKPAQ
jgi:sugar transferase (PEP-CTERM/EpsH1 system associated)